MPTQRLYLRTPETTIKFIFISSESKFKLKNYSIPTLPLHCFNKGQ